MGSVLMCILMWISISNIIFYITCFKGSIIGLQKRSKKISSGAFISIMEFEDVIDSRKH